MKLLTHKNTIGYVYMPLFAFSGIAAAYFAGQNDRAGAKDARPAMVIQAETVVRQNQNWKFNIASGDELKMTRSDLADHLTKELAVREVQNAFQVGVLSQYGYAFDWQMNLAFPTGEDPKVQR